MVLTKHVPSHLVIAEQRVLISYDGQPTTCYGCGETGHIYPTCPRRQRRTQLPPQHAPVTYAAVAATMPHLTGDRPNADTQRESNSGIERDMGNNGNSMDPVPTEPGYGTFPMDSTTRTEEGDPPSPPCTRAFNGSPNPSQLEVTDPPKEMDDVCQQTAGAVEGPLPGKGDDTQSQQTLCHPLSPNQPSVRDDDMTDDMEASTPQQDILKPEDPLANPKRPKKMRYDKSPHPPQERTRSMTRRVARKDGKG